MKNKVYIVAEIGCNHNGNPETARAMVKKAYECGVDAVKFQTFNSELLISKYAPKAEYQIKNTGNSESQLEMTKKLELPQKEYLKLRDYALSLGIDVFSTGFDEESNEFLYQNGQKVWKIPSGEITNLPYLRQISQFQQPGKKIVLSTGMATKREIKDAVAILKENDPDADIILLHCNTEYPTEDRDVNVSAIKDLQRSFPDCEVGFSDHSRGIIAPIMAVAYGVRFIEKHFTLDKELPGPDHKASVDPKELEDLCVSVRRAEMILGSGEKYVTDSERKNKIVARKSIVAKVDIKKGDIFSEDNIICKRPGSGISPMKWDEVLGKKAEADFEKDELIRIPGFEWQE